MSLLQRTASSTVFLIHLIHLSNSLIAHVHTHVKELLSIANYFARNFAVFFLHCLAHHLQHERTVLLCFMLHCVPFLAELCESSLAALFIWINWFYRMNFFVLLLTFCSASQRDAEIPHVEPPLFGSCSKLAVGNSELIRKKTATRTKLSAVTFPNTKLSRRYELLQLRWLLGVD